MKTTKEKIAVMQAHEDGKEIRMALLADLDHWTASFNPTWDWPKIDYEVEPEPMVIYKIRIKDKQTLLSSQHYSSAGAEQYGSELGMSDGILEIVKFVEDMSCTTK